MGESGNRQWWGMGKAFRQQELTLEKEGSPLLLFIPGRQKQKKSRRPGLVQGDSGMKEFLDRAEPET